ncbi:MAG: YqaE/Pmp3 family membrane protein [Microcystis sp.]
MDNVSSPSLCVFLPPLAVFLTTGLSLAFVINIILTLIGYVPGIIHAFWIVSKEAENS